ncbi:hypothetical protein AZE42_10304 [Rhizopogon vesiculosus]|uniref:Uncharacterized protein n=1 Tax=Rhizopogon vesiculosus TaxID=180088 RepID=A0A1J8PNZ4_9AGAM|nr:hypothetical protein AZE42_10304 [Rhizopogon vesiculosus]
MKTDMRLIPVPVASPAQNVLHIPAHAKAVRLPSAHPPSLGTSTRQEVKRPAPGSPSPPHKPTKWTKPAACPMVVLCGPMQPAGLQGMGSKSKQILADTGSEKADKGQEAVKQKRKDKAMFRTHQWAMKTDMRLIPVPVASPAQNVLCIPAHAKAVQLPFAPPPSPGTSTRQEAKWPAPGSPSPLRKPAKWTKPAACPMVVLHGPMQPAGLQGTGSKSKQILADTGSEKVDKGQEAVKQKRKDKAMSVETPATSGVTPEDFDNIRQARQGCDSSESPTRAVTPANRKVVLGPLVEVMDVDTDSVDEADSDYEDELEEDKQHVGSSNDLAPAPGSRRKGATKMGVWQAEKFHIDTYCQVHEGILTMMEEIEADYYHGLKCRMFRR